MTALTRQTATRDDERQLERRDGLRVGDRVPEARPPRLARLPDERRQRAAGRSGSGRRSRAPCAIRPRGCGPRAGPRRRLRAALSSAAVPALDLGHDARPRVEEPLVDLRPAAEPLDREQLRRPGSRTASPRSAAPAGSRSRPKMVCAGFVRRKSTNARAVVLFSLVLSTAIGFSIRIVAFGIT